VQVRVVGLPRWVGRAIGLDVHRTFCEIATCEAGVTRSAGRVPATPDGIESLARSLWASDRVALEVTGSCWEVVRLLEPHVNRVVVVSPDDTGIASARAKTDKLDAQTLAGLLWRGELEAVWMPDERCRILRRRLARREQLVRSRSRAKNEIHACLQRRLQAKPTVSDLFGVKGRQWLARLQLPLEERESVDAGMRHIEFLDGEIAAVEKLIAQQALSWPEIRRLMRRRDLVDQRADAHRRDRTRQTSRNVISADGPRPAGWRADEESGRERDTGARIDSSHSLRGHKSRGRPQAPDVCASLRHRSRLHTT
jgi:transposase